MKAQKNLNIFAWSLSAVVIVLAVLVWGNTYLWRFSGFNSYMLFPLFGLVAFSLMWSHYIVGAVRRYYGIDKQETNRYFEVTAVVVLLAILLHPGLLWWQLWRDGLGLPPKSAINAYPDSLKIAVIMGGIALIIFLLFELRRFFGKKSWWKYVDYANILAMGIIFIHALRLGGAISGWYKFVWFFYGLSLIIAIGYTKYKDYSNKTTDKNLDK